MEVSTRHCHFLMAMTKAAKKRRACFGYKVEGPGRHSGEGMVLERETADGPAPASRKPGDEHEYSTLSSSSSFRPGLSFHRIPKPGKLTIKMNYCKISKAKINLSLLTVMLTVSFKSYQSPMR